MKHSHPFRALWALMVGLFLIVVDSTVVAVANPALKDEYDTDYGSVFWVTSGYLLAFAALLLVGGRLGDRFGPKYVYVIGLAIFSAASVWCGLSESIGMLTLARVVQGAGAALLAPQIFTTITRMFPLERRGVAMSVWGATTGMGLFAGPILGGVLLDQIGWRWIFFGSAPIGVIGLVLAVWLVPALPGRHLHMDPLGVLLSGAGIFLIVFGLQESERENWSPAIWFAIAAGLTLTAVFFGWQAVNPREPLIPLRLVMDRNFLLSNGGIATVSFAFVAFVIPLMIFLQEACGLSAVGAALLTAPMAVATVVLAPVVGKLVDRVHPRPIVIAGFAMLTVALLWLALEMSRTSAAAPMWRLLPPLAGVGVAGAFTWEPLAVIASRALPPELAGAGSALCNTARQLGAALSSASVAALSQSMLLPVCAAALGGLIAMFIVTRERGTAAPVLLGDDMRVAL